MENFVWDIRTRVYFGRGQVQNLGPEAAKFGKTALLVFGGGSIKKNGVYDAVKNALEASGVRSVDFPGVEPNPRLDTVRRGITLCRACGADMVIGIGGGSSIDCAKAVAAGAPYGGDVWDLISGREKIRACLPILAVLTIAATGSEMNVAAVVTNTDTLEKLGFKSPLLRPAVSILDPAYSFSVPPFQTASGAADIVAHTLEDYLPVEGAFLQDRFAEGILKTCISFGPTAVKEPENYEARANLMWAGSHAINGLLFYGKAHAWTAHAIEHQLSAYYDVTHGAGLAVVIPAWLDHILSPAVAPRIRDMAVNVFGLSPTGDDIADAKAGIEALRTYFTDGLGLPATLRRLGIPDRSRLRDMAEQAARGLKPSVFVPLSAEDVLAIYESCF